MMNSTVIRGYSWIVTLIFLCGIYSNCESKKSNISESQQLNSRDFEIIGLRYEGLGMISQAIRSLKTAKRLNSTFPVSIHIERVKNMVCSSQDVKVC